LAAGAEHERTLLGAQLLDECVEAHAVVAAEVVDNEADERAGPLERAHE